MTQEQPLDQAHDPSHELSGAVVQRVFYVVHSGRYPSSPEFSTRDQALTFAQERSDAGEFGSIVPVAVEVEVCAEFRLESGRITQRTLETFHLGT